MVLNKLGAIFPRALAAVLIIGALIVVWILIGITNLGKINTAAMVLLFILTLVLCKVIFFDGNVIQSTADDSLSFGAEIGRASCRERV